MKTIHPFLRVMWSRSTKRPASFLPGALLAVMIFTGLPAGRAMAQSAAIQGIISDQADGQPLEGANIVLREVTDEESFRGTVTDRNGFYQMDGIPPGRHAVRISYIGYTTHEDTLDLEEGHICMFIHGCFWLFFTPIR